MNRKLLCRIITNVYYILYPQYGALEGEIDLLRNSTQSNIWELNKLMSIHRRIIDLNGIVSVEWLYKQFLSLSSSANPLNKDLLTKLTLAYSKDDYIKCTILILNNTLFRQIDLLFLELLVNAIWQRKYDEMLIIRQSYFGLCDITEEKVAALYKFIYAETEYYTQKKQIFTIDEIKQTLRAFFAENKEVFSVEEVYLFGSYAKGKNDEFSDVDLMIMFNNEDCVDLIRPIIKNELKKQFNMCVDVVPIVNGRLDEFDATVKSYAIKIV